MAFERFLAEGEFQPRQIRLCPHIDMRSNLKLFVNRISVLPSKTIAPCFLAGPLDSTSNFV